VPYAGHMCCMPLVAIRMHACSLSGYRTLACGSGNANLQPLLLGGALGGARRLQPRALRRLSSVLRGILRITPPRRCGRSCQGLLCPVMRVHNRREHGMLGGPLLSPGRHDARVDASHADIFATASAIATGSTLSPVRQVSGSCRTWRQPRPPRPASLRPPRPPQPRAPRRDAHARARLPRPRPAARARRRAAPSAAAWCQTCCGRPAQHARSQAVTTAPQGVVLDSLRLSCGLLLPCGVCTRPGDVTAAAYRHAQSAHLHHELCANFVRSCGAGCCAQRSGHDEQHMHCAGADNIIITMLSTKWCPLQWPSS